MKAIFGKGTANLERNTKIKETRRKKLQFLDRGLALTIRRGGGLALKRGEGGGGGGG